MTSSINKSHYNAADSNGRNIWKTRRDKERMHARHEILERVVHCTASSRGEKPVTNDGADADVVCGENETDFVPNAIIATEVPPVTGPKSDCRPLFCAIEKRDIAAFGVSKLSKLAPMEETLDGLHSVSSLNLQKAYYMCASRFGLDFGKAASAYLEMLRRHNIGITMVSYAAMLGEYQIVNSLLKGGADPTVRWEGTGDDHDHNNERQLDTSAFSSSELAWRSERSKALRPKFLRLLFLDYFPPTFAVWIVRCIVVMRINGVSQEEQEQNASGVLNSTCRRYCAICKSNVTCSWLNWGKPCHHSFCENCCWEDIMQHIDDRDEIVCPICQARRMDTPTSRHPKEKENTCNPVGQCREHPPAQTSTISPTERARISLEKFNALPPTKDDARDALRSGPNRQLTNAIQNTKKKNSVDISWSSSIHRYLGKSQEGRREAFFDFVARNAIHYVRGYLEAGVDVNAMNDYYQTNLYIASWHGYTSIVKLLLEYGADPTIRPSGMLSTALSVAQAHGHADVVDLLEKATSCQQLKGEISEFEPALQSPDMLYVNGNERERPPVITKLISETENHPGAGSFIVDHAVSESTLRQIERLWKSLPVEYGRKGKESRSTCATRLYFCDAENILTKAIAKDLVPLLSDSAAQKDFIVMPHMRFLHYEFPKISLAPHVDLARIDRFGRRSTHTFLLYLFDCEQGGETLLLRDVASPGCNEKMAVVKPRRGRLLVFPHSCPHEGGAVISVPKVLIRGEVHMG